MQSLVIEAAKKFAITESPIPSPAKGEVLLKVHYSGVCGSDMARFFEEKGAKKYPLTAGHEFSAEVVSLGEGVSGVSVGKRVVCVPLIPCMRCSFCEKGQYALCARYSFIGSRCGGGNQEYVCVPALNVLEIPKGVSYKEAAFFEPLSIGLHALLQAGGVEGKHAVIFGAGTIGLLLMQALKPLGARSVTAIDIVPEKLRLAGQLGANNLWDCRQSQEAAKEALDSIKGDQVIFETSGVAAGVLYALGLAHPRATLSIIGILREDLPLQPQDFNQILRKELTLKGSWMSYGKPYPGAAWTIAQALFLKKAIQTDPLTEGVYSMGAFFRRLNVMERAPMRGKILLSFEDSA